MATKKQTKDEAFEQELERRKKAESGPQAPGSDGGSKDPVLESSAATDTADAQPEAPTVPSDDAPSPPVPDDRESSDEQAGGASPVAPVPSEVVEVVAHPADPNAAFQAMERYDETQIIEEIEGRMSEVLVYKIPTGMDLSFSGVREAIRLIGERTGRRINTGRHAPISEVIQINGESYHQVKVYAEDEASGQGYWGTAQQPVRMKLRADTARKYREKGKKVGDDDTVDDEFAYTKALSKAQRNALKYFIPEQIRQGILAIAKNDPRKLREITMGAGAPMEDKPKALGDPEAEKLIASCRETYQAIGREFPDFKTKVPPGRFNSDLQAAWSSHEALRTLLGQLEDTRSAYEKAAA